MSPVLFILFSYALLERWKQKLNGSGASTFPQHPIRLYIHRISSNLSYEQLHYTNQQELYTYPIPDGLKPQTSPFSHHHYISSGRIPGSAPAFLFFIFPAVSCLDKWLSKSSLAILCCSLETSSTLTQ